METETKRPQPKRHYEPKLSLYPLKFEDAIRTIAKAKPAPKEPKIRGQQNRGIGKAT
jgi:hypothetical protein